MLSLIYYLFIIMQTYIFTIQKNTNTIHKPSVTSSLLQITSSEYGCFDGEVNVELTTNEGIPLQSCRLDSTDEGTNLKKKIHLGEKAM